MMYVKDLIAELQNLDPEMPVYVFADHGQTNIQAGHVSVRRFADLEYYAEEVDEDEVIEEKGEDALNELPLVCIVSD